MNQTYNQVNLVFIGFQMKQIENSCKIRDPANLIFFIFMDP